MKCKQNGRQACLPLFIKTMQCSCYGPSDLPSNEIKDNKDYVIDLHKEIIEKSPIQDSEILIDDVEKVLEEEPIDKKDKVGVNYFKMKYVTIITLITCLIIIFWTLFS